MTVQPAVVSWDGLGRGGLLPRTTSAMQLLAPHHIFLGEDVLCKCTAVESTAPTWLHPSHGAPSPENDVKRQGGHQRHHVKEDGHHTKRPVAQARNKYPLAAGCFHALLLKVSYHVFHSRNVNHIFEDGSSCGG